MGVHLSQVDKVRTSIRVHWLPEKYGEKYLTRFFETYGRVIRVMEEISTDAFDEGCLLGTYEVILETSNEDIAKIPHLVRISSRGNSLSLLLTMAGRHPHPPFVCALLHQDPTSRKVSQKL